MTAQTIPSLFFEQANRLTVSPLFWVKGPSRYRPLSWTVAAEQVESLALFLLSQQIQPGDRVVILSENRHEWAIADLAIQSVGAWTVPLYPSLTSNEIALILRDCEPAACIVSNGDQAKKLRAISPPVASIRALVIMDTAPLEPPREAAWAQALGKGRETASQHQETLQRRLTALQPEQTATLIYTSGTTGEPKGVMLSHRNFLSNVEASLNAVPIGGSDRHLSFLPLCHVFERMAGWYLMLRVGASIAYADSMDTIPQDMLAAQPTIMLGVPRFFEKLHARIQDGVTKAPPLKRRMFAWALGVGQRTAPYRMRGRPLPAGLALRHALADTLVYHKVRQRLGGRLRFFVSGSAPLAKSVAEFFYHLGVVILEGYGLTETSPVIAVNRPDALKFGTVGPLLDGVEVKIAEDGEILTRGPHVMQGYYRKPEQTAEVIHDGWFSTGDIGMIDAEGFLVITDRKKDLIKTAGGKFIAPQKLEQRFISDPLIAQAFVYGDRQPYCVALIVPNMARLAEHAMKQGWSFRSFGELVKLPAMRELMWARVNARQQDLPGFEQVKAIALLEQEFTQAGGELTPTLKAKRAAIATRYEAVLHGLYHGHEPA